eukprot:3709197-Rhodomonas_salina.5
MWRKRQTCPRSLGWYWSWLARFHRIEKTMAKDAGSIFGESVTGPLVTVIPVDRPASPEASLFQSLEMVR